MDYTEKINNKVFWILIVLIIIMLNTCEANAADKWTPDPWTGTDTAYQIAYTIPHIIDCAQSIKIANNPDRYHEINLLIGEHPSPEYVVTYFAASYVATTGIAYILPSKWRRAWHISLISIKVGLVAHNYNIGLKWGF